MFLSADFTVNILSELMKQGPLIALLAYISITLYKEQKKQQAEIQAIRDKHESDMKQWQDKTLEYMNTDRKAMLEVLENNTRVMEDLQKHLENEPRTR